MNAPREPPVGAVTFGVTAAAFVLLAGPSLGVRDAGELASAAFLVDVPHPTGFVADMVLARIAMLVPLGDIAFRANLVVALAMAGACAFAARVVFDTTEKAPLVARLSASAVTAVALASARTVLRAGTAFEVYAISLLAALAAIALIVRPPPGAHRYAALLAGASVLMHTQARPAALLALAVCTLRRDPRPIHLRRVSAIAVCGAIAALPVGYLLLAARAHRPIDWGDPSTAGRLLAHLTAQRIREAFATRMFVAWRVPEDFAHVIRVLREDLGYVVLALSLVGVAFALQHRAMRWVVLLGAVDLVYATVVNPMGVDDRQTLYVALAMFAMTAGFAAANGAVWLVARSGQRAGLAVSLGAIVVAVASIVRADGAYAARADGWTESELLQGAGALGAVPPRSVVLCDSDDLCGGALYAQYVEGERPDVAVLPRQHLADEPTWRRFRAHFSREINEPTWPASGIRVARLRWITTALRDRVRWEQGEVDDERIAHVHLGSSETPVLAAIDAPLTDVDDHAMQWLSGRDARGEGGRRLAATVLVSVGRREASRGIVTAIPYWRAALDFDPDHAPAFTNLGVAMARAGALHEAVVLTERALEIDPNRRTAWRNLAEYRAAEGDTEGAAEASREAARR